MSPVHAPQIAVPLEMINFLQLTKSMQVFVDTSRMLPVYYYIIISYRLVSPSTPESRLLKPLNSTMKSDVESVTSKYNKMSYLSKMLSICKCAKTLFALSRALTCVIVFWSLMTIVAFNPYFVAKAPVWDKTPLMSFMFGRVRVRLMGLVEINEHFPS